jgi:hypothetical protein
MEMVRRKKEVEQPRFPELNIFLVVLALVLIAGGVYWIWGRNNEAVNQPKVVQVENGFVSGFPVQYILEQGITPEKSSLSTYSDSSQKLWNAVYISNLSPQEIITKYRNLFGFLDMKITQETANFIYAKSVDFDVSVSAVISGSGTKTVVSYLNK